MDRSEFAMIVAALKNYYPTDNLLADNTAVELWYRQLGDLDYKIAEAALLMWVSTEKWPPSIAEFREKAADVYYGEVPDWSEGWEQVVRAVRKYGSWDPDAAYEMFDGLTLETVRRLGYVNICVSENWNVDRANFRQIYTTLAQRKKQDRQISPKVMQLIEKIRVPMLEG